MAESHGLMKTFIMGMLVKEKHLAKGNINQQEEQLNMRENGLMAIQVMEFYHIMEQKVKSISKKLNN